LKNHRGDQAHFLFFAQTNKIKEIASSQNKSNEIDYYYYEDEEEEVKNISKIIDQENEEEFNKSLLTWDKL
jgi:hypothetical protein